MKFAANWNEHFIYKGFLCARTVDSFAGQMESLEQDYNTVVAELENSFVDSKAFWERTTTDKKATASQKLG